MKREIKKLKIPSELVYVLALLILSFAVALTSYTDFGVSMVVAPAYILSNKITALTFGQCEYIVQAILFVIFCLVMKKFKPIYLCSFATCLIYGVVLDLWRIILPKAYPQITDPEALGIPMRILLFCVGIILTGLGVALFFRTYFYPQLYDFFIKGLSHKTKLSRTKCKTFFDLSMLTISIVLTLILFHKIVGIGIGTVIMALFNGTIIGAIGKLIDKTFTIEPIFVKASKHFEFD